MTSFRRALQGGLLLSLYVVISLAGGCSKSTPKPSGTEILSFVQAVKEGDTASVKNMISTKPSLINWKGERGALPLHTAALYGQLEVAKILLDNGANINAKDADGNTALHCANVDQCCDIAKLLIANGANLNTLNNKSRSPLHAAIEGGSLTICELLVEKGAKINVSDNNGWSCLHWAAFEGRSDIVKLLLENRANPKARTRSYLTLGPEDEETRQTIGETSVEAHSTPLQVAEAANRNPRPVIWLAQYDRLSRKTVTSSEAGRWGEVIALLSENKG